jgi:hypothetical protein
MLFVDTEMPSVHLYSRGGDGRWEVKVIKGLAEVIGFPKLQVVLKLNLRRVRVSRTSETCRERFVR